MDGDGQGDVAHLQEAWPGSPWGMRERLRTWGKEGS